MSSNGFHTGLGGRHQGHVHRRAGEVGPPELRWHRGGADGSVHGSRLPWGPHRHPGGWEWVEDVRTCPACMGPAAELLHGFDRDGSFEVWGCARGCGHMPIWESLRQQEDRRRLTGERGRGGNWTVLRDADYSYSTAARARAWRSRAAR